MTYSDYDKELIENLWGDLLNYTDEYYASPEVRELIHSLFDRVDDFKTNMEDAE